MRPRNTAQIFILILYTCFLSCKTTESEETGTTFPESFQNVWESQFTGETISGYFFTDSTWYAWNLNTLNPTIGNCYDYYTVAKIIDYEENLFNVENESFLGEKTSYSVTINIESNNLVVKEIGGNSIYFDTGSTLEEHIPRCDFTNTGPKKN
ncbi:MAG: hypothetical protein BalsKO_24140 [Balneolaceae bacterium]